ncbi:MFS general substrate transporter [Marasmius fiardii PR-910]|nr:MFS general substrate transporter [Marasmius fiardii PR-910]
MSSSKIPGTFALPRIITLLAALLCALGSGTNYGKAYAPQLGARLHINHTLLNIVGLGGNVGMYLSGPFSGRFIDKNGPRLPLLAASVLLLVGYSGIRFIYTGGLPEGQDSLSSIKLVALVFCSFVTGVGGNSGMITAINTTAKTFPDSVRGSTTGMVISGFGLSALFFSTLAHLVTSGDTASLLLLLALGTSLPMILGFFFARPIPLHFTEAGNATEQSEAEVHTVDYSEVNAAAIAPSVLSHHENDSRTPLLSHDRDEDDAGDGRISIELSPPRPISPRHPESNPSLHRERRRRSSRNSGRPSVPPVEVGPNLFGRKLFVSSDFWLLVCILSLLSGTGLMYINNVGSMSQALYVHEAQNSTLSDQDQLEIARWQAVQVSTISFMNFSGRVFIGFLSDFVKARLGRPRSYLLVLVSFLVTLSQVTAMTVDRLDALWKASTLLGLGYGTVFSLFAALCVEWFGLAHFSENWGYLSLAPLLGGNVFSVAFGRNLDAHEKAASGGPTSDTNFLQAPKPPKELQCLDGKVCYVDSIRLTTFACLVAMGLSIWAAWRDRKRYQEEAQSSDHSRPDVIWETDE